MPIADSHTALSTCRGAPVTLESAVSIESSAWRVHWKRELVPQQPEAHAWGGQGKHWGAWRPRASTPRSPAHTSFLNHLSRARVHTQGQRDTADGHTPPQGLSSCRTHRLRRNSPHSLPGTHRIVSSLPKTHQPQEQLGALNVRKPQRRGTHARKDGDLGGWDKVPELDGRPGATDTAEGCCAAPRARDWGAQRASPGC